MKTLLRSSLTFYVSRFTRDAVSKNCRRLKFLPRMHVLDWTIVLLYMVATLALGVYLAGRASGSLEDFFVSGRSLPWWLAGTSMAATTFSIDTPLYIAGVVGNRGIAGNWEWWAFGIGHVFLIYLFERMWRRSAIVTDAEQIGRASCRERV